MSVLRTAMIHQLVATAQWLPCCLAHVPLTWEDCQGLALNSMKLYWNLEVLDYTFDNC